MSRPLDVLGSLKVKLGALVAASVVAASLLTVLGSSAGVPTLLVLPVAVALSLGVTQLLAAGMVAPLREMTGVAQRMARGDYAGRVRTHSTDEVGRLAEAFNQMAADLGRVDAERRDLIATVSHELRTPLAAMTAVLDNLVDGVVPADADHLGRALAQAERLHALVEELLDLSRVEAGVAGLAVRPTPLAPLVSECVEEVRGAGRPGEFLVEVPPGLEPVADPARLRQLLVNVLDNAARHSPQGRPVRVRAGRADDPHEGWWLEVLDEGPGVPAPDRERVFERFGTQATGGGTGLGLAVARWVAGLHGGRLRFLDPQPGAGGARLRLDLPATPPALPSVQSPPTGPATQEVPMTTSTTPAAPVAPPPPPEAPLDALFGRFWPETAGSAGSAGLPVVLRAAVAGLLAGSLMTFTAPGASWVVVLAAAGAAALAGARHRRDPFALACAGLALLLVLPVGLRDNEAIAFLGVLTAGAVFLVGVTRAHTTLGFVLAWLSWPLAALRGLPWLGRSLRLAGTSGRTPAVVRTVGLSVLGLAVFGGLLASADALFASWVDAVVPNLTFGDLVLRGFVATAVFGLTLAAAYLALNPSRVEREPRAEAPTGSRFEWLVPVLTIDLVLALFLVAQAAVVFGGHGYVERTTGLTYADYVHQGFGQLTVVTALTLLVAWAAARRAGTSVVDRRWLHGSLGLLCLLTLVVVASALHRMDLYQEAYGFTTLRLVVDVFEGWLGLVVLTVAALGAAGRGRWVPRTALVTGALVVLGLAAVNPDAWVAGRNIDRYEATGRLDVAYLQSLSADAAPVIADRLPADIARCATRYLWLNQLSEDARDEALAWNLGRARAADSLDPLGPVERTSGAGDPCAPVLDRLDEHGD